MPENNALAGSYITINTQNDIMAVRIITKIYNYPSEYMHQHSLEN